MKQFQILLVSGNPEIRKALKDAFKGEAVVIDIDDVDDQDRALEALVAGHHDICFILNRKEAPQLAHLIIINAQEAGLKTPIIVLSNSDASDTGYNFIADGAIAEFILDPYQLSSLSA